MSSANPNSCCPQQKNIERTILLVEDEAPVREVTRAVLEHAGYQVLECNGPEEGIRLGNEYQGRIGLLLSDVVMPGMSGPELGLRLRRLRPGLITIFMSGYADRDVLQNVLRDSTTTYIPKPFTIEVLLAGVAKALHTPPRDSALRSSSLTAR